MRELERARSSTGVPRGFFLTLEGVEGSGKTTHAKMLRAALEEAGATVTLTREPGGTPLGEALRHLLLGTDGEAPVPEAELFMLLASRAQHLQTFILPRLDRGEIVICDRFADASLAYQGGGRKLGVEAVALANALATSGIAPDYTVLFDLSVEEALARVGKRGREGGAYTRFDQEARDFHEAVRSVYLRVAAAEPERFLVVDAALPKPDLSRRIRGAVETRVARRREDGGLR
jgi:dTMP kinase